MTSRRGKLGAWGETQACSFLERQGFVVIERNYHTTVGEVDIVAQKGADVYFIEVKTRAAGPMAYDVAVTAEKQRRMKKAASVYCYRHSVENVAIIAATLMVIVEKKAKTLRFRLAVLL